MALCIDVMRNNDLNRVHLYALRITPSYSHNRYIIHVYVLEVNCVF